MGPTNESTVVENCHFAYCGRYIFRNIVHETKMSQYTVLHCLFIDIETDNLE